MRRPHPVAKARPRLNRAHPHHYVGYVGARACPDARWVDRRLALLQLIANSPRGLSVNGSHRRKTYTAEPMAVDLRRLLREGLAVMSGKERRRPRYGAPSSCRALFLTDKGRALLPVALEVPERVPYAHRKAAWADFLTTHRKGKHRDHRNTDRRP